MSSKSVYSQIVELYKEHGSINKDESRRLVEEHLQTCPDCRKTADILLDTRIERELHDERESVLAYGAREFRRRSAIVGSAVSGSLTVPVLVCIVLSLFVKPSLSWVSVVLASLCVLASLIAVPLLVREDKLFWTFCAFCASLILLLGVTCLYAGGHWFGIAASAVLFGLSVVFLPFLLRAAPVRNVIGGTNRLLVVLGVDFALLFNLLNMIETRGKFTLDHIFFVLGTIAGIVCVLVGIIRNRKTQE